MLNARLLQTLSQSRFNAVSTNNRNAIASGFPALSKPNSAPMNQFLNSSKTNIFNTSLSLSKPAVRPPVYAPVYRSSNQDRIQNQAFKPSASILPKGCKPTLPPVTPPAKDVNCKPTKPPVTPPAKDEDCPTTLPPVTPPAKDEDCPPTLPPVTPPAKDEDCPPTQPPVTPPYDCGTDGGYEGDPHLTGFDGEKYDVMGQAGKTYNMLSDKDFQYNTQFESLWGDNNNAVGAAGIQVGSSKVSLDAKTRQAMLNNSAMTLNQKVNLDKGGTALWDGTNLAVTSKEYNVNLKVSTDIAGVNYLDSNVKIASDPFADGVKAHGLVGQTADGIAGHKNTGIDQGSQGGTVIDGTVKDYEVSGLFDTTFSKFNRFKG